MPTEFNDPGFRKLIQALNLSGVQVDLQARPAGASISTADNALLTNTILYGFDVNPRRVRAKDYGIPPASGDGAIAVHAKLETDDGLGNGVGVANVPFDTDAQSPANMMQVYGAMHGYEAFSKGLDASRSHLRKTDTFTGIANGPLIDTTTLLKTWAVQVNTPWTAWNIVIEGSLDAANFTQIVAHTNTDGNNFLKQGGVFLTRYVRSRVVSLTGSGTTTVNYVGSWN